MADNLTEKRKTVSNNNGAIITAKVIGNYGDAGLSESSQFDILSRFVIVMIESTDRVPTQDNWYRGMIAAVMRPQHLWITAINGLATNPTSQQRADYLGNTNTGLPTNYSVNSIPSINQPYQLGEIINIKKLAKPFLLNQQTQDTIFQSVFTSMPNQYYDSPINAAASLPYIQNNNAQQALQLKNVGLAPNTGSSTFYYPLLGKFQYEAFALLQNTNNNLAISTLTQIFNGTYQGNSQVYNAKGGYIFNGQTTINIPVIDYLDVNTGNKERNGENSCIPLVVVSPSQFPIAATRSTGLISYSPTVVQVSA